VGFSLLSSKLEMHRSMVAIILASSTELTKSENQGIHFQYKITRTSEEPGAIGSRSYPRSSCGCAGRNLDLSLNYVEDNCVEISALLLQLRPPHFQRGHTLVSRRQGNGYIKARYVLPCLH
jgi:hypothetical protein